MFYDKPANVVSFLPEKLQSIVEFGAIGNAVNPEIDKLNAAVGLMAANAFIDTVDNEGLKRWEKILGVSSPLTVYKQRIINDPYHFTVASEKDYVKEASISGNAVQNGTPTPEAPIMPVCLKAGDKIDIIKSNHLNVNREPASYQQLTYNVIDNALNVVTNSAITPARYVLPLFLKPHTIYYVSLRVQQTNAYSDITNALYIRTGATSGTTLKTVEVAKTTDIQNITFTFNSGEYSTLYFWFYPRTNSAIADRPNTITYSDVMVSPQNISYEPYTNPTTLTVPCDLWATPDGLYKDKLNVLTGDADSDVTFYEITGAESGWYKAADANVFYLTVNRGFPFYKSSAILCSHYGGKSPVTYNGGAYDKGNLTCCVRSGVPDRFYIRDDSFNNDITAFKANLAAKYAAGNPVTVWFARATTVTTHYTPQPMTLPVGTVNMVVESSNGVLPSSIDITLAEYQADETFQARKNAIKSKLMTKPPINLETLRSIIEAYMGVEVETTIANSVVSVVYRGDTEVVDLSPLYATLYETIPANLLVEIAYKYLQWLELDAQSLDFDALDAKSLTWDDFERGDWIA